MPSFVPKSLLALCLTLFKFIKKKKNPMEARFSAPVQTGPGPHPASCTMGTGSFTGVKNGQGVTLTHHPSSAVFNKE